MDAIRNFSIIAHIDHGKSTLADRLIQATRSVSERDFKDQVLDTMDLERERGITIKSQTIAMRYEAAGGSEYLLNLIDTPGHVDFTYEVSRALASCEGVLLVVDASQGVEAQTLANYYLALENDLEVIPVVNKIDLQAADIEATLDQIESELDIDRSEALLVSAREGTGVPDVLEAVVRRVPPPRGSPDAPLRALLFDSQYDPYRGAVMACRVFDGRISEGEDIRFFSRPAVYRVEELGVFRLRRERRPSLRAGEVGYVIAGVKNISDANIGDTLTLADRPAAEPLPGYREIRPVVFSSLYPSQADDYDDLAEAVEKLKLNDPAFTYEKDSSVSLGFGFRCGFLGLLHLDIIQERLEREYGIGLILTAPSVRYRVHMRDGEVVVIDNPVHYPDPSLIEATEEPFIRSQLLLPDRYLGRVHTLCQEHRGENPRMNYLSPQRVELSYDLPLAEVLFDFYDRLKSATQGYASFDYEILGYRSTDLVKLDILVNGERVDALSQLVHRSKAQSVARRACDRLRETIPRQMFKIPIQGALGSRIIARSTIYPLRKDVTAKCYGGDVTRKRKLLEKQREGKKRMKRVGAVEIPQEAFLSVLRSGDD